MAHKGIYVTPNQVVANKNRKTKFDELSEEINNFNISFDNMNNKYKAILKEYCSDTSKEFYEDWNILEYDIYNTNLVLTIEDRYGDSFTKDIPKEWLNNKNTYLKNLKEYLKNKEIEKLKMEIKSCKRDISNSNNKLSNFQKELQELEEIKEIEEIKDSEI